MDAAEPLEEFLQPAEGDADRGLGEGVTYANARVVRWAAGVSGANRSRDASTMTAWADSSRPAPYHPPAACNRTRSPAGQSPAGSIRTRPSGRFWWTR